MTEVGCIHFHIFVPLPLLHLEQGLTRLGKVAQDRRVSIVGEGNDGREAPSGERRKSGVGDSTGNTTRSSPARKSRAVGKTREDDDEETEPFRYTSPGRNLVVVRLSPGDSVGAPSARSSFQTAQGSPASVAPTGKSSGPGTPQDPYDEEEESVGEGATLRQLCSPTVGSASGSGEERREGTSEDRASPAVSNGGTPGSERAGGDGVGETKERVSEREEERESKESSDDEKGVAESSSEAEESESEATEESSSNSEGEGSSGSSSAASSPRAVERQPIRLNKAIYCRKEFDR